jgi:WD40 repeat protein
VSIIASFFLSDVLSTVFSLLSVFWGFVADHRDFAAFFSFFFFYSVEPHLIVTGGWDNTVQIFDARLGYSIRSLHGPHICGEALEFEPTGRYFVTGSYVKEKPLEVRCASTLPIHVDSWDLCFCTEETDGILSPSSLLQLWDFRKMSAATERSFDFSASEGREACPLYTAGVSRNGKFCYAGGGGAGSNELRLFDFTTKKVRNDFF